MRIILSPRAEKELKKMSKLNQIAVVKKIRLMRNDSSWETRGKLRGYKNIYRVRVGDNRIVYKRTKEEIYIVLIANRKDIYRLLKRLLR